MGDGNQVDYGKMPIQYQNPDDIAISAVLKAPVLLPFMYQGREWVVFDHHQMRKQAKNHGGFFSTSKCFL